MEPRREDAWRLLCEFNESDALRKHALAVEAVMRYAARKRVADEDKWGVVGLIHDLDFERFPDQHCSKTGEILRERGWPEEIIRAAVSHGWGVCSDTEPQTEMEKVLFAVDELTGLVAATALVRPTKSIHEVEVKSVRKKWNQKQFAAGVNREVIEKGAAMLGIDLDELVADTIEGMKQVAAEIGLGGQAAP